MPFSELLNPAVLMAVAIALAFPILVMVGVAVLRRVIVRRNPELAVLPAESTPATPVPSKDQDPEPV